MAGADAKRVVDALTDAAASAGGVGSGTGSALSPEDRLTASVGPDPCLKLFADPPEKCGDNIPCNRPHRYARDIIR